MPEVWFCGVEPAWQFFAAPLLPLRCYFSAALTREELEEAGVTVFDSKDACNCIQPPPAPASPPAAIYFCGLPAVQRVALTSTFTLWIGVCGMRRRLAASVCSGVCFAVSPLVWGYSTTAEVFAMNNLFGTSAVALAPLSVCYAIVLHGNSLFDSLAALGQWACCC